MSNTKKPLKVDNIEYAESAIRLRLEIERANIPLKTLATMAHYDVASISRMKNGKQKITEKAADALGKALNVSPRYLLGLSDKRQPFSEKDIEDAIYYNSCGVLLSVFSALGIEFNDAEISARLDVDGAELLNGDTRIMLNGSRYDIALNDVVKLNQIILKQAKTLIESCCPELFENE